MENKPNCTIDDDGTKRWILNGHYHREDGPALEFSNGTKYWYIKNICHRLDGPAIIDGSGSSMWCFNGHEITDEITQWAKDNDIDLDNLSEDDKLLIKLVWSDYGK